MTTSPASSTALRILCITDASASMDRIRDVLGTHVPGAEIIAHTKGPLTAEALPPADCVVADGNSGARALEIVRQLRAGGWTTPVVLVADDWDAALRQRAGQVGASACVDRRDMSTALGPAMAAAMRARDERHGSAIDAELQRTQRLIAAGEIALGLQHDLNNPLAGILAESQLLEMEELPPEQHEAVERIVNLCRRLIVLVRRLDGVSTGSHR